MNVVTPVTSRPGDGELPHGAYVVLDATTGRAVRARTEPQPMPLQSPIASGWAWWAADSSTVAPGMDYFIDSASTVDTPPVTTVRDWSGRMRVVLAHADIDPLLATDGRRPSASESRRPTA
ncbi:hypothetical protein [Nonomuraea dietziae]|uniref:hypothetical protein n=1 Tax=Nonomuraea dietziae TaxID=65515 RepID=UPI00342BB761